MSHAYSTYSPLYSWAVSVCFVLNTDLLLRKRLKAHLLFVRKESKCRWHFKRKNLNSISLCSLRCPEGCRIMSKEDVLRQWNKFTDDFDGSAWMKDELEIPFCGAYVRTFGEKREGAPWKALDVGCGTGRYTVKLMQAGWVSNHESGSMFDINFYLRDFQVLT